MNVSLQKNEIRKKLLLKRKSHDEYKFFNQNEIIIKDVRNLLDHLYQAIDIEKNLLFNSANYNNIEWAGKTASLSLYWPLKGEPDLLKLLINSRWHAALPKLHGSDMKMIHYEPGALIEKSSFGEIYQPVNNIEIIPNVIIVPGVAFSMDGYRLGFGKGHYDKYMTKINQSSKIITIGICFHDNLFEHLPYDEHDMKLDYIITDKIFIRL